MPDENRALSYWFYWLYVNSWVREKSKKNIEPKRGELGGAMKNAIPKSTEITNNATNTFENFRLVVAAFGVTVCI